MNHGEMSDNKRKNGTTTITSGEHRGKAILTPGDNAHPMGSREKIALFNMINDYIPGAKVLDTYAGSGALGLEALSRGAEFVLFVDSNFSSIEVVRRNAEKLGLDKACYELLKADILRDPEIADEQYDLVLADPPYDDYHPEMITIVARAVVKGGILVASTPETPPEIQNMELLKTRKYARAHISVFRRIC